MIPRTIQQDIINKIKKYPKGIIIYGPRQVGKTTLAKQIISALKLKSLEINADEGKYFDILSSRNLDKLSHFVEGYDLLFIDEAQRIPEIGINLKILLDNKPDLKIIVTGSSSLDLTSQTAEAMTGRTWNYNLYPISFSELKPDHTNFDLNSSLKNRLIFGSYPYIFSLNNNDGRINYLQTITNAYLYKDILELAEIRNHQKIRNLLKLLAFQIGSQVSLNELSNTLEISKDTVFRYLSLLEQSFVIFRLSGFSRNLRKEISKTDKYYFYDLGIRNTLIENFNYIDDRNDIGQLWENFLIVERLKKRHYQKIYSSQYYWRTYTGAEIDLIEERDGKLFGFEFKWSDKKVKAPQTWLETYDNASFQLINQNNYLDFIC